MCITVPQDLEEPGAWEIRLLESFKRSPGFNESFLNEVFGDFTLAGQAIGEAVEVCGKGADPLFILAIARIGVTHELYPSDYTCNSE